MHSLIDWVVGVGVLLTFVQTIYMMLTFHSARAAATAGAPVPFSRRHFVVMSMLTLLSWGAVAANQYLIPIKKGDLVSNWGISGDLNFFIEIATQNIIEYEDKDKLIVILTVPVSNVDRMTDTRIAKSSTYSITGKNELMSVAAKPDLGKGLPIGVYAVVLNVALIPNNIDPDRIRNLADVHRLGGEIIASPALGNALRTVPLGQ
jgi:hypothetical protein